MTDVLTFGESMAAVQGAGPLRLGGPLTLSVAGAESNVAIALARLGHAVEWIGRIGDDELGQLVLRTLRAEGVDLSGSVVDATAPTGVLFLERRIADITRVSYYRAGSAGSRIRAGDVLPHLNAGAGHLHVTGITAALGAAAADAVAASVAAARDGGVPVSLDVNFRSRLWSEATARSVLRPLLPAVELVFASEDEVLLLSPEPDADADTAARRLVDEGVPTVVLKHGAAGASLYSAAGKISAPARVVPVVDLVGAGDAFVAGFLSARLDGLEPALCLDRGVVLGAFAVSRAGDWEGLPTRSELTLLDASPGTTLR